MFVDGPHGSFSCDFQPAESYLFIAGGIGIAPILSMLRTLADRGDRRPVALVYACSRWDRSAFRTELADLERRLDLRVVFVLEEGHPGWEGHTGYGTRDVLAPLVADAAGRQHVFICGPNAMTGAVEAALRGLGVPETRISLERFHLV